MREWAEHCGVEVQLVHSGGHAWPEDLRRLTGAIAASETVWVHTDSCGSGIESSGADIGEAQPD